LALRSARWIAGVLSVNQQLAAIRHVFDWLVVGQVMPLNPAGSVRPAPLCRGRRRDRRLTWPARCP
jgi:site-specific recombinase XerC